MKVNVICKHCGIEFIATHTDVNRGKCKYCSHYCSAQARIGTVGPNKGNTPNNKHTPQSFWNLVDKSGDCWLWTLGVIGFGYGSLTYQGKAARAHRLAYTLGVGAIPKGMQVLHKCDNPLCCNPDHLFLGNHKDNINDRIEKDRTARGEQSGTHKLTDEQVLYIKQHPKPVPRKRLAIEFGVGVTTIDNIIGGVQWKHI